MQKKKKKKKKAPPQPTPILFDQFQCLVPSIFVIKISISPIDRILTGSTFPGQSEPESKGNESCTRLKVTVS